MQNKASQQRAARLWARVLCYCVHLVTAEEEDKEAEEQQEQYNQQQQH
jgi:hypothetical protein